MLEGTDVSSYQGVVSWSQVRQAGKAFAFVKASEGISYRDPNFPHNWAGTHANGLVRGAYHYLRPSVDPVVAAQFHLDYVEQCGGFVGGDFIAVDLEVSDGLGAGAVLASVEVWVSYVLAHSQPNVLLYTYPSFWIDTLGNPLSSILAPCPLWLADYGPSVPPLRNWPGGLSIWQYSDVGHVPGIAGNVNLDRFYGSMAQLKQLAQKPRGG